MNATKPPATEKKPLSGDEATRSSAFRRAAAEAEAEAYSGDPARLVNQLSLSFS